MSLCSRSCDVRVGHLSLSSAVMVTLIASTSAFHFFLPGLAPVNYCEKGSETENCKSKIPLYVNILDSEESNIPYEYDSFDFCKVDESDSSVENVGPVFFGERIRPSTFDISFKENKQCRSLCPPKHYKKGDSVDKEKLDFIKRAMLLNYQHHWIVDNMPVTWCYEVEMTDAEYKANSGRPQKYCSTGFPVGCYVTKNGIQKDSCVISTEFKQADTYYLFNHWDIYIQYHSGRNEDWGVGAFEGDNSGRIISIRLKPRSIKNCNDTTYQPMAIKGAGDDDVNISYSYSISFGRNDEIKWSSRWDYILDSMPQYKWFSITNVLVMVLFLLGMVAIMILLLRRRFATFRASATQPMKVWYVPCEHFQKGKK